MKKKFTMVLVLALTIILVFGLFGCGKGDETTIKVVVPDGAPALAVAKLMDSFVFDGYKVEFEIVDGTNVAVKMSSGEADIAIMPTNLAAKLYSGGLDIYAIAANVFGLLYVVGTKDIPSLNGLGGEKIVVTGQGGTPDFVTRYLLTQNGVQDPDIIYVNAGSDAIAELKAGNAAFAVLGEPAATMAAEKTGAKILFNLQEEWEESTGFSGYPQACTVITKDIMDNHTKTGFLKAFLTEMRSNVDWIKENVGKVNEILDKNGSTSKFSSAEVIERCNIRYVGAQEAKESIDNYLSIMQVFNANFVGGKLPDDGFYAGMKLD